MLYSSYDSNYTLSNYFPAVWWAVRDSADVIQDKVFLHSQTSSFIFGSRWYLSDDYCISLEKKEVNTGLLLKVIVYDFYTHKRIYLIMRTKTITDFIFTLVLWFMALIDCSINFSYKQRFTVKFCILVTKIMHAIYSHTVSSFHIGNLVLMKYWFEAMLL